MRSTHGMLKSANERLLNNRQKTDERMTHHEIQRESRWEGNTHGMATAGSGAARATPDAQAQATRAAIDETATAGGSGARAQATAETQARAARAVVDRWGLKALAVSEIETWRASSNNAA